MGHAAGEDDDEPLDDDDHDDHDEPRGAPPDPLDRVWVHPAELPPVAPREPRRASLITLVRPFAIGALGALVTVAVLAAMGAFDDDEGSSAPFTGSGRPGEAAPGLLADGAGRGVVLVTVRDENGARRASGVSLRHAGEVLTSAAAVGTATTATITSADGTTLQATVIGRDGTTDLALLEVTSPLPAVPVSDREPEVGDNVWILGGAGSGGEGWRAGGIVASTDAMVVANPGPTFAGLLETDAPTSPAAAGGALVDGHGEVTGIVLSPVAGRQTAFAVPVAVAIAIAKDLRENGVAAHGALGLVGVDSPSGPVVTELDADSAADRAGVTPGDVIVEIEGRSVLDMGEVTAQIRRYGPGKVVAVTLLRVGEPMAVDVQLSSTTAEPMS